MERRFRRLGDYKQLESPAVAGQQQYRPYRQRRNCDDLRRQLYRKPSAGGSVTIASGNLSATAASNILQVTTGLMSSAWSNIAVSVGVSSTNWVVSPLPEPSSFYRVLICE